MENERDATSVSNESFYSAVESADGSDIAVGMPDAKIANYSFTFVSRGVGVGLMVLLARFICRPTGIFY